MSPASPPRPTRADRRQALLAAILDATIASVIEDGYATTTTRRVADRVGISQGALQYYFPTRAALVEAAVTQLAGQIAAAIAASPLAADSERERAELILDALWDLWTQPLGTAIFEFVGAARTDPEVADRVGDLLDHVDVIAQAGVAQIVPGLAAIPGTHDWVRVAIATIHGTAQITTVPGGRAMPDWPTIRKQIMAGLDAVIGDAG